MYTLDLHSTLITFVTIQQVAIVTRAVQVSGLSGVSLRVLLLIRRGDYVTWAPTAEGKVLAPCGGVQAKQMATALMTMSERPPVVKIFTSTMVKAQIIL